MNIRHQIDVRRENLLSVLDYMMMACQYMLRISGSSMANEFALSVDHSVFPSGYDQGVELRFAEAAEELFTQGFLVRQPFTI